MTIEVKVPRFREVRLGDVRVALGESFAKAAFVDVLVLSRAGESASAGRLYLVDKRSGCGLHRRLACPACHQPRAVLYVDGNGGLGCARCTRHRTRRQLERTCRDYRHHGGREEDELHRLLASADALKERLDALARRLYRHDFC